MQYSSTRYWLGALAFAVGVVGEIVHLAVASMAQPSESRRSPFRRAVMGHSKREVVRLLGPPPAATGASSGSASTYWIADAWYYPFDRRRHTAVAVLFDSDRAVCVEFIAAL